jgi:predicted ATP-dependent endonuclease of OLD family
LRLAVLETLLELSDKEKNFILLIEEPESYLHVHLKRYFSHVLRKLAKKGHQVVFTTHSPEFADLSEPYEVIRVTLGSGEETCVHQVTSSVALDFEKAKRKLRRLGNEELLFASHVFLTEGQDDQALVEWLLEERGVDQDANSISVIQCDGVENLPDYIGLCATLGIDFYVIHDEDDITNKSIQDRNAKIREAVEIVNPHRPSLCTFSPYLEAELGLQKHCGLAAIQEHLGKTSYEALARSYPTVVKPIQEFLESRGLAPSLVPVEVATP